MTSDYYELFKNVGKEVDLEEHKKSANPKQQSSEKAAPKPNVKPTNEKPAEGKAADGKADVKAAAPAPASTGGKKAEYPLTPEDK